MIKQDGTFYEMRWPQDFLSRVSLDWANFATLAPDVRRIVFEAISDMGHMGPGLLRYRSEPFDQYFADQLLKEESRELTIADVLRDDTPQPSP